MQDFANTDCMRKLQLDSKKTAEICKKTCTMCMNVLQNETRRRAAAGKNDMYKIQENFPKIFTLQTACRVI